MEQHAVPQDITGFKFKLVGDMTLKQFGELAAGATVAYLFYASNWNPLLKWPFVFLFGVFGIALAFVPIEERPLDLWIVNFLRAIYRPTIYVWKKNIPGGFLASDNFTTKPPMPKPEALVPPEDEADLGLAPWPYPKEEETKTKKIEEPEKPEVSETVTTEPEIKENEDLTPPTTTTTATTPAPPMPATPTPPPAPVAAPEPPLLSIDELQKLRDQKLSELDEAKKQLQDVTKAAKEEAFKNQVVTGAITIEGLAKIRQDKISQQDEQLKSEVAAGDAQLNALISQNKNLVGQIEEVKGKIGSLTGVDTTNLKQQLDALSSQKDTLSTKIAALSDQLAAQRAKPLTQPAYQEPRATSIPGVRVVDKPIEKTVTVSLSGLPNVISGMVVSEKGGPIEGVIILIKDKTGNSIRALKTNKLGQFVVATPMENGTYYVEMEKSGYNFSVLEVTLSGQVLAPLEIPASLADGPAQAVTQNSS